MALLYQCPNLFSQPRLAPYRFVRTYTPNPHRRMHRTIRRVLLVRNVRRGTRNASRRPCGADTRPCDGSGGALHTPVTTYFYLELGASATDIGLIGSALTAVRRRADGRTAPRRSGCVADQRDAIVQASLVLSPLYGYLLDRFGPYPAMLVRPPPNITASKPRSNGVLTGF
jgi:hypothetical protein